MSCTGDAAFEAMQRETVQPWVPMPLFSRLLYGFQAAATAMKKYPLGSLPSVTSHLRIPGLNSLLLARHFTMLGVSWKQPRDHMEEVGVSS